MGASEKRKLNDSRKSDDVPRKVFRKDDGTLIGLKVDDGNTEKCETINDDTKIKNSLPISIADSKPLTDSMPQSYRKRKRHYFNAIRNQMEFYFGDPNLTKDRFLRRMIDEDPYVPLEIFLTFNKIKMLTSNIEDIVKALSNSTLLELDELDKKVKRKTPLPTERNVDEKILYVESLPPTADHDWIRCAFEQFGKVAYISLPKYAKTKKLKGFAFIEFEREQSVQKAVKTFQKFNGVLLMLDKDLSELASIKAYINEHNEENKDIKDKECNSIDIDLKGRQSDEHIDMKDISSTNGNTDENPKRSDGKEEIKVINTDLVKKKRRKKRKVLKTAAKQNLETKLSSDIAHYELKILPKCEWKRLRNKYLNMQRERAVEWKRKRCREQQLQIGEIGDKNEETNDKNIQAFKTGKLENHLQNMNMNFYGANDEDGQSKEQHQIVTNDISCDKRIKNFSYEPGLIVEMNLLEPCVDVKEFKNEMRQYTSVKYIDVKEGNMVAHIRLESSIAAIEFVRQINCAEYQCKILSGENDMDYWRKIEYDREQKINKSIKVPQKRGREKIQKIISTHIHFDDDKDYE